MMPRSPRRRITPPLGVGPLHGNIHSLRQSGVTGFGLQSHERTHGGDLIVVFLHAPVEGSTVFCTDQRLRRPVTLGHMRHVEPVAVYYVVKVAAAFFLETKTVNTPGRIASEGL
jgi:hypothetical protein